jgi:hypothetical protein
MQFYPYESMDNIFVTKVLVGFLKKSSVKFGITSIESGKFFSKNSATSPLSSNEAKNSHLQMA